MKVIKQARDMSLTAQALRRQGKTIGFVPTMGALHDGHLSLIRAAAKDTKVAVASIFVNPLQFGPQEDVERYPRDLKRDLNLAKAAGCDLVFAPDVSQMYPPGFSTSVDVGALGERLEGASRPGHFRGVATVVTRLLQLVQPAVAYVGQKDYQQAVIIERLIKDLAIPVSVRVMPTVREADGLAMSSRNGYLTPEERGQAPVIHEALQLAKTRIRDGERDPDRVLEAMRRRISEQPLARIDYLAVVHAKSFEPAERLVPARPDTRRAGGNRLALLAAVRFGPTRLIDNLLVDVA